MIPEPLVPAPHAGPAAGSGGFVSRGSADSLTVLGGRAGGLIVPPSVTAPPTDEEPGHRRLPLLIAAVVLVLTLVAAGGVYYFANRPGASTAASLEALDAALSSPSGTSSPTMSSPAMSTADPTSAGSPSAGQMSSTASVSSSPPVTSTSSADSMPTTAGTTYQVSVYAPPPPRPTPKPPTKTVVVTTTQAPVKPVIKTFTDTTFKSNPVVCGSNSIVQMQMTWSTTGATRAWVGVDSGPDASVAPYISDLPDNVGPPNASIPYVEVPFACGGTSHTYTLTVQGDTGKASKTITYAPGPPPTMAPPPSTGASGASGGSGGSYATLYKPQVNPPVFTFKPPVIVKPGP